MKVLHVYRTYFPDSQGGLEEVIRQICSNTKDLGIESRVLTITQKDKEARVIERPEALVVRTKQNFELASCNVSFSAFSEFKTQADWADIIHYHFPWPFADLLHLVSGIDKPTVLTYHSDIIRQKSLGKLYRPLMLRFLGSVKKIVCTSPNYFATSDVLSRFADKVDVIPIGIDRSTYPKVSGDQIEKLRNEYGEDFFLFVGVLRYYKGLEILLRAVKGAPYRVVIAGSGPIEDELRKEAETESLDNVIFTGYVSDDTKVGLFQLCRAITFPSYLRSEAFGVTLLEGAMFGKPLISTEVGSGTSHVNVHEVTGFVLPPGSPKMLRKAMDQLFHRPDMAKLMGVRARERYEKLFTGIVMGRRYASVYRELNFTKPAPSINKQSVASRSD